MPLVSYGQLTTPQYHLQATGSVLRHLFKRFNHINSRIGSRNYIYKKKNSVCFSSFIHGKVFFLRKEDIVLLYTLGTSICLCLVYQFHSWQILPGKEDVLYTLMTTELYSNTKDWFEANTEVLAPVFKKKRDALLRDKTRSTKSTKQLLKNTRSQARKLA